MLKEYSNNNHNSKDKNIIDNTQNDDPRNIEIDKITGQVLKSIQLSEKDIQHLQSIENEIIDDIKKLKRTQIVDIKTGGSFAKDTNLNKDIDIDIFILIDKNTNVQDFESIALDVGFKSLKKYKPTTRYSEHPYVEGYASLNHQNKEQIRLNVVPCYDVEKGSWKSSADRSQYHTEYMKKMLNSYQKNEIRILKVFLKAIGIYGAELSTAGFSGYVTEVLILKYGSFKNVIKNISMLKQKSEIISIDSLSSDRKKVILDKFQSPIIILDPIDLNRNLGTAISPESLSKFIFAARAFLSNPSIKFFNIHKNKQKMHLDSDLKNIKDITTNLLVLEFEFTKRSHDIIWGQLMKLTKSITRQLDNQGFAVLKSRCYVDNAQSAKLVFLLKFTKLSPSFEKHGPTIFMEKETLQFLQKNMHKSSVIWIGEDMSLVCLKDRNITDAIKFIKSAITKHKNSLSIPKGLVSDIEKGFKIYTMDEVRLKNPEMKLLIHDFLFKDMILFDIRN